MCKITSGNVCPECGKPIWDDHKSTAIPELCSCVGKQAHVIMTEEEYQNVKIIGWHEVCKNYDGCGGIAIRYLGCA